jgi:TM2 domain-containing membrane protein YozV
MTERHGKAPAAPEIDCMPAKPGSKIPAPPAADLFAGLLSYLVPGLGQFYQGRVGKGVLFFFCIYGLFGYGMYLGRDPNGRFCNVFLPDATQLPDTVFKLSGPAKALITRPQFCGQFWVGIAAWPAILQYAGYDGNPDGQHRWLGQFEREPSESQKLNPLQTDGDKTWDLGWVCTVIAGVLNIMVIYDAAAGPAFRVGANPVSEEKPAHAATSSA